MNVLSVKQPWALLLCLGIKDIENRTWKLPEKYMNETIYIHASAKPDNIKLEIEGQATAREIQILSVLNKCNEENLYEAIIGSVRFIGCGVNNHSAWAEKTFPAVYDDFCASKKCEYYIEWDFGGGTCYSCKKLGQSYNIEYYHLDCPHKKEIKRYLKPIYNWIAKDPVLLKNPIRNIKGKLSIWQCPDVVLSINKQINY